jgi:formylmethanofuran:tetrahydromethanopterin formyltransferase
MNNYQDHLKDYFNDDRIPNGVKTLLSIYINRSIESVESVIQVNRDFPLYFVKGVVDYEKNSEPFENENG